MSALNHVTRYRYDHAQSPCRPNWCGSALPPPHSRTPVLSYSLNITPKKHFINWQQDAHSNWLARLVFPEVTREFNIEVDLVADLSVVNPFDFFLEPSATNYPFQYDEAVAKDLKPYLDKLPLTAKLAEYAAQFTKPEDRIADFIVNVNRHIQQDIRYVIRLEPGVQTPAETLAKRSGSCRDSAWLLCQVFRHLGLASRFVSGYLIQLTADVKALDGPSGPTADFTDLHAWTEVYLPGAGWIGLDPTSGLLASEGHIPLAATPDPVGAAPITGAVDECETEFEHAMKVTRIRETPRVTKPYSEEQWSQIEALGHRIDLDLQKNDVRLTMGGEPTFVSIDDMEGAEWNSAAIGPRKRELAGVLLKRIQNAFAPGSFLHYGQGKWYPGESLPRWAFGCYWRKDGQPIWTDPALSADETKDYGFTNITSELFIRTLAKRLGVDAKFVIPAYEDVWYYLWKERRLPVNVDPLKSELANKEERARLAHIFEQGLADVAGHVLPLRRQADVENPAWESGLWFQRTEHMFLTPGDSPAGYRLPLDSMPWVAPKENQPQHPRDPFAPREPLPQRRETKASKAADAARESELASRRPKPGESAPWIVRTALCVEPRGGRLYVFMPPAPLLEDYLDLVTAVEETAAELKMPVIIEGYPPPHDERINHIKVTPDPGVIEVNMHPAHSWEELVKNTTALYEEARQSRLGAEKFMVDGRHTGTGGGNHIVLGGATPGDSPFLRRPDILRSLVGFLAESSVNVVPVLRAVHRPDQPASAGR